MDAEELAREEAALVAEITPERVAALVAELRARPNASKSGVAVHELTRRLLEGRPYDAATRGRLVLPVQEAIAKAVAGLPGMKYIEGG